MKINSFSDTLINLDKFSDKFFLTSPVNNLIDIFFKCVVMPCMKKEGIAKNRFFSHLKNKSILRCLILVFPLGSIFISIYDCKKRKINQTKFITSNVKTPSNLTATPPSFAKTLTSNTVISTSTPEKLSSPIASQQLDLFNHLDAEKIYNLACVYDKEGPERNLKFELYKKASDLGHAGATSCLGYCYYKGEGVDKDAKQAFTLFKKASDLGNAEATFNLAICYYNGEGVDKDAKQAFELYKKAADLGHVKATFNLACRYDKGEGVDKDAKQAFELYKKAADLGHAGATSRLGYCYDKGEGVDKDAKQAFELYKKAADLGHAEATFNLAICYDQGVGVDKDAQQAFELYKKAADLGQLDATFNLACRYYNGEGVDKDAQQAFTLFKRASDLGHAEATCSLAVCYHQGEGVDKDAQQAFTLFKKASDLGNAEATFNLAICYYNGVGVDKDAQQAFTLFKRASDLGDAEATFNLAIWYDQGSAWVDKDTQQALTLYEKASDLGHVGATFTLVLCSHNGVGRVKDLLTKTRDTPSKEFSRDLYHIPYDKLEFALRDERSRKNIQATITYWFCEGSLHKYFLEEFEALINKMKEVDDLRSLVEELYKVHPYMRQNGLNLSNFYNLAHLSDLTIETNNEFIRVHKTILRSVPELQRYLDLGPQVKLENEDVAKVKTLIEFAYDRFYLEKLLDPTIRPTLIKSFEGVFNQPTDSDFTIESRSGEKIYLHKVILEASDLEYFKRILNNSNFKENNESKLVVDDEDFDVIKIVIEYVYTDVLPEFTDEASKQAFEQALNYYRAVA